MFRCQATGKVSKPGEKPYRVVLETRAQSYENQFKDEDDKWHTIRTEGYEIVREMLVCREYYEAVKLETKV